MLSTVRSVDEKSAAVFVPEKLTYAALKQAADGCEGCELYKYATQTVFGEGKISSRCMFVGEQPGDEEDLVGRPFIGPAGRLLDKALLEAGIERSAVYLTNVVKHFKWKPKGKRRLHQKPKAGEIRACEPWLRSELELIRPTILVCLGATAAQTLLGKGFKVTESRGEWLETDLAAKVMATVHPSSILRAPDSAARQEQYRHFLSDLAMVSRELSQ